MAKIAIFDPNWDTRETLLFALQDQHDVVTADNVRDLLKKINEEQVEIVFAAIHETDDDTAKEDGRWLCKELRRLRDCKRLPVVLMGHLGSHKTRAFVQAHLQREYGATAFIQKPLNPDFVLTAVDGLLWAAHGVR